ncbi:unnamed protein product [Moneuplotes crassus]|uniref:SEC7 domain-containing protein n=1 Tax=Euplotes crassus TaxID=5936 RepID=A0AAD1XYX5_EUPCR|nr:unnamed protein product [Moneuplotes crassus]
MDSIPEENRPYKFGKPVMHESPFREIQNHDERKHKNHRKDRKDLEPCELFKGTVRVPSEESESSCDGNNVMFLDKVGVDTISKAFDQTRSVQSDKKKKSDVVISQKSSQTEGDDCLERLVEDINSDTVLIAKRKYEYPIDKIYQVSILEEQKSRGSNITRGGDVMEAMGVDPEISEVLTNACSEFAVSPRRSQDMLIQAKIINYGANHFAKFLYTQPIRLMQKSKYLFELKDEFALEVRECFYSLFNFEDLSMKEFLLTIHTKVSPPVDSEKKSEFYEKFCAEYAEQNSSKGVSSEDLMFMLCSTFFIIADKKNKSRSRGISLEQYLSYAEEHGKGFMSLTQARAYYEEIKEDRFIQDLSSIIISVDGIQLYEDNINFMRNVHKILPKEFTKGDEFFESKTLVYKIQLKTKKIKQKEICIDEKNQRFCWFNPGSRSFNSIKLRDIYNVEIGFTPVMNMSKEDIYEICSNKIKDFIENQRLCFSIETDKRTYDFYGTNERDIQLWYSRLKSIAEKNINNISRVFPDIEKTLYDPCYDWDKQNLWEEEILPNWPQYFDTSTGSLQIINDAKLKLTYDVCPEEDLLEEVKESPVTKNEKLRISQILMYGFPCKVRTVVLPLMLAGQATCSKDYYEFLESKYNPKKKRFEKYKQASKLVVDEFKQSLRHYKVKSEGLIKRITKMMGIFYEIQRKDIHFSGHGVVKLCLYFTLHLPSDSSCYACFSSFLLKNMATLQLCRLEEEDIFNTIQKNTLKMNVVKSKSVADSDTDFIVNKLEKEFKAWGNKVKHRLAKSGIEIYGYVNQLRVSFLTCELPIELISVILDQCIVQGDYALVKAVITFLYLKWSLKFVANSEDISPSLFYKTMSDLKLQKEKMVKNYYDLKREYKAKIDLKNILMSWVHT